MKFHCDRCNTRYSIADERVRGKILKVRCKNCSAVIAVKEGAFAADNAGTSGAGAAENKPGTKAAGATGSQSGGGGFGPSPATRLGTSAPTPSVRSSTSTNTNKATAGQAAKAGASALQGAFAQAIQQGQDDSASPSEPNAGDSISNAPASLEAEWYVSVDGDQVGPYTLTEAQEWILAQRSDDELYCWSEGFDDWLAVEKVSHFRGLRTPPQPVAPPPVPSPPPVPAASPSLFSGRGAGSSFDIGDEMTEVQPSFVAPHEEPSVPLFAATMAKLEAAAEEAPITNGRSHKDSLAAKAPPIPAAARPASKPAPSDPWPANGAQAPSPRDAGEASGGDESRNGSHGIVDLTPDSNLDFEIGEASRVVRLPMLFRDGGLGGAAPVHSAKGGLPGVASEGDVGRGSGSFTQIPADPTSGTGAVALPVVQAAGVATVRSDQPQQTTKSRKGLWLPVGLGAAVLVALAVVVLVVSNSGDDDPETRLARANVGGFNLAYQFEDQDRDGKDDKTGKSAEEVVEDIEQATKTTKQPKRNGSSGSSAGSSNNGSASVTRPSIDDEVDLSGAVGELDPDDLMEVYRNNKIGVTLCYNSALKKDPLLSVSRADVSINVNTAGQVSSVTISKIGGTELGTCLQRRIKAWRFPKSRSGLRTQFPIVFDN